MSPGRTPDFYLYAEAPISGARRDGEFVVIRWPDGAELRAYALWLFENRMGDEAIDEQTRENKLDPADLPSPDTLAGAAVAANGDLELTWNGYPTSLHHSGWLRHMHEGRHAHSAHIPPARIWTVATLPELPTFDGPRVLEDDDAFTEWLTTLVESGVARLTGLGNGEDVVAEVGLRVGALRDTNFGTTWPITADVNPGSVANTALPLAPHSDLPTRETPPGYQLLHCQVNECSGGLSHMTDGYAVARRLQEHEPEFYEVLCRANWIFFNRSPEHDHRWSGPLIDHGGPHSPLTFRTFHPVRGFPDMAEDDVPLAYAALRRFSQLARSDEYQLRSVFSAGELVAFDNRRILHGRGPFRETKGRRVLRGAYVDHDEVYSRLRVLMRRKTARISAIPESNTNGGGIR
ncbi:MAG: TauD/TfdA family dioxygenase [Acidimicrobiaceae bacterium]|nr:TauD/TfdA family dioxygenase [Acidimicrobiia bacterium]MCY4493913.1 TauD/TfdA family dioxygenase [Acidimicrobiaceae bacterium]